MERSSEGRLYPLGVYAMGVITNLGLAGMGETQEERNVHNEKAIGFAQRIIRSAIEVDERLPDVFRTVASLNPDIRREVFRTFGIALSRIKESSDI